MKFIYLFAWCLHVASHVLFFAAARDVGSYRSINRNAHRLAEWKGWLFATHRNYAYYARKYY